MPLPKYGIKNLASKKLETSIYCMARRHVDIVNRFSMTHKCDRQTDGQTPS